MNTADNSVNTYACTRITISSSPDRPTPTGSDSTMPTPSAAAWPNSSKKMNTNDRIARIAICPPVMLAARRMVNANGRTSMPISSRGISSGYSHRGACGTRFFQCCTKPCARVPAMRSEEHTSELQSLRHLVCRPPISTLFPYTTLFRSHERQDREDRDMSAGHVGGKTHGQRERSDQHADQL